MSESEILEDHDNFVWEICHKCGATGDKINYIHLNGIECNLCKKFYCAQCQVSLGMDMDKGNAGEFCKECSPDPI